MSHPPPLSLSLLRVPQIAERAAKEARAHGLDPTVLKMADYAKADFEKPPLKHAVFIVETVENAQPAEAAGPCVRFFNRRRKEGAAGALKGLLSYAVLGLGDTNLLMDRQTTTAADCNQAAQTLDSALKYLGAAPIVERGEANDAVGLEEAVAPWLQQLWAALAPPPAATPAAAAAAAAPPPSGSELLILYGSQTGNSAEVAQNVAAEAAAKGVRVRRAALDTVKPDEVVRPGSVVLFVVSSTGDGDPPDNAAKFYSALRKLARSATINAAALAVAAAESDAAAAAAALAAGETPPPAAAAAAAVTPSPPPPGLGAQYCVLGLGDQNYTRFMAVPRWV